MIIGEWIPNFEYMYSVTQEGVVYSYLNNRGKLTATPRIMHPYVGKTNGYLICKLRKNKTRVGYCVHRLVLETFVGKRPEGMEARHLNGDKKDPRLENLKWGTYKENAMDACRHGVMHCHNKKLREEEVRLIYKFKGSRFTQTYVGKMFKVSNATVSLIWSNSMWKYLDLGGLRG